MTKNYIIKLYKKYYTCNFEIELLDNVLYTHNNLNLFCEIPYQNNKEKQEIYELLTKLLTVFNFSYTLEFNTIEEIREFINN